MNKFLSRKFVVWLVTAIYAGLAMFLMEGASQYVMLGIFGATSFSYHFMQGKIDLKNQSFDFVSNASTNNVDLKVD
jgi:uncharacterized membrane protein